MLVTRKSIVSGKTHTLLIPNLAADQLRTYETGHRMIQDVLQHLSPAEREFLMTGVTSQEWEDLFDDAEKQLGEPDDTPAF